ncbi:hypothetical protein KCF3NO3_26740 [Chryseobacterium sp. KCF3-3]
MNKCKLLAEYYLIFLKRLLFAGIQEIYSVFKNKKDCEIITAYNQFDTNIINFIASQSDPKTAAHPE